MLALLNPPARNCQKYLMYGRRENKHFVVSESAAGLRGRNEWTVWNNFVLEIPNQQAAIFFLQSKIPIYFRSEIADRDIPVAVTKAKKLCLQYWFYSSEK